MPKVKKLQRNHKRRLVAYYGLIIGSSLLFILCISVLLTMEGRQQLFTSPLPTIKGLATVNEGEDVKVIKKALKDKSIVFESVTVQDSLYIIHMENDAKVTLSAKKDIIVQISSLQFILARLTMEGRQFRSLDLQFDKPIIVFKEK